LKLSKKTKHKGIGMLLGGIAFIGVITLIGKRYNIQPLNEIVQGITYPFQKTISLGIQKCLTWRDYLQNHLEVVATNQALETENNRLSYENTVLQQYKEENIQLKELLEMQQRYKDYPSTGANIIGKETGNLYQVFTIDKGKVNGINTNDVVLSGSGLVGHVIETTAFSSQVLSIIDDRSYISTKVLRTNDIGILRGDIELVESGLCKMEIDIEAEVVKGDLILTSHLSSIYPPGIPIGVVEDVLTNENGLIQYAYIKPYVDFKHLENVLIISPTH
jgi:rod shape-determining protein MreC